MTEEWEQTGRRQANSVRLRMRNKKREIKVIVPYTVLSLTGYVTLGKPPL